MKKQLPNLPGLVEVNELPEDAILVVPNKNSKNIKIEQIDMTRQLTYLADNIPASVATLQDFITELSETIGLDLTDWAPTILPYFNASVLDLKRKKMYNENKTNLHVMMYEDDCFRLEISEYNDNTIEILWFKVKDKCKGLGTEIMNKVLDTADNMGINVRVLPVDFEPNLIGNQKSSLDYLRWLNEWYKEFDFKPYSIFSPALMYTSK